ncbi:hypothetical protein CW751_04640 [Brumimicrobium salinarum]|uniref:Uncharacterized protein n=1 Tax=Brumimicrobium salinarum TaxID=2058658 RepID=A0A2I0R449_9FLAO|nr:hypothetical protein [Brumimicrobium salinarum]PKR81348.1 hypothetical protein CW751_04640 [Brumimicrobium salinarum]
MEISYTTKEEANRMEEKRFLALKPSERLIEFLNEMPYFAQFPSKKPQEKEENFIVILNDEK